MVLPSRRRRAISRNDSKTFPLPDDFFPEVKLTDEQVRSYERQAQKITQNALLEYGRHEAKGPRDTEGLAKSQFRLYGRIHGNYRNLMDFHYAETSQELFEWNQFMYGYVVDAVVLKNIHTRSSGMAHEYMGIKWTCLQPSSFSRKRDNCFLEYLTYTKDELGRNVGVRVTFPVSIKECPDLYRGLRVKRVKTHTVTIVRPAASSSDETQLFIMSKNDFAGSSVSARNFRKFMRIYNDLPYQVDSKYILRQGMMCRTNWMPDDSRKACTNCQLPFNAATRRRSHCRLCGDIFCHHCVISRNVPRDHRGDAKSRAFQVAKTNFCKACLQSVRGSSLSGFAPASSTTHASSVEKLGPGSNGRMLRKAHSNTAAPRQDWWDDTSSRWSESDWSETDSDDKASLNASGISVRSLLASSLSSSQSSWTSRAENGLDKDDMPFVTTLDVIDDDVAVLGDNPRQSKSRLRKSLSMSGRYSVSKRHSVRKQKADPQEVAEVIDTADMVSMSEYRRQSRAATGTALPPRKYSKRKSMLSSSGPCPSCRLSREEPSNRFRSSRSISQCLAEQEELLRCMLSVSRVHSNSNVRSKGRPTGEKINFAATMPVPRPTVRLYDL
ncbi:hypothetical protein PF002_g28945 [Phytophthora fragariae]|uniref:FYVE-type domain-containing protein n=1 Tax=Phytophthora fragariae TaxID=53985 RepID=A0A6A3W1E4_9STRA|nr:hypothetical protein PF006_g5104 [Phytophthora fragariae]KAE9174814.1 hypothetical protein PF002_g28945 [Phytophthora fragariae]KAE9178447.1 hypothetical protein PF004_g25483 [Phytophthora fragariae]KAE9275798.1 hypothetical protein PF001_g26427 [Phytophthora fragariae]